MKNMSELVILTSAIAVASVAVNIGTVLVLLKFRKKLKEYEFKVYDYAQSARVASNMAGQTFASLSEIFHDKFDDKERELDETLKHAKALSDTMVDAFHHRLDEAVKEAKSLDKR